MSCVLVVDTEHRPLNPMHPGAARRLLTQGNAAVWRRYPFTIILKRAVAEAVAEPLRLTIAPGSRTTGLALVSAATGQVVWAAAVTHRGQQMHEALLARSACRCGRRHRHTRYRPARFDNRRRHGGWRPPSLASRLSTVLPWVSRLRRLARVAADLSMLSGGGALRYATPRAC